MNKDKEPEQLASIALSREEIASRQRTNAKPRVQSSPSKSSGAPKVLWALTVFALVFCVALLVELYSVKKQLSIYTPSSLMIFMTFYMMMYIRF